MWSTRIGGPRPRFVFFSRFTLWSATRATTCPRIARPDRTALRPQVRAPDPPNLRIDIVTLARPVACQPSMHRSRTQCCPSTAERARETGIDVQHGQAYHGHDDGIGASGGKNIGRTLERTRTTRSSRGVTRRCAPLCGYLPAKRRASCSRARANERVRWRRSEEGPMDSIRATGATARACRPVRDHRDARSFSLARASSCRSSGTMAAYMVERRPVERVVAAVR